MDQLVGIACDVKNQLVELRRDVTFQLTALRGMEMSLEGLLSVYTNPNAPAQIPCCKDKIEPTKIDLLKTQVEIRRLQKLLDLIEDVLNESDTGGGAAGAGAGKDLHSSHGVFTSQGGNSSGP